MDDWESPDVSKDGTLDYGEDGPVERGDNRNASKLRGARETLTVAWLRIRFAFWSVIQVAGFAALLFGITRFFAIGLFQMESVGPLSRAFFMDVYLPGDWSGVSPVWTLAWIWMGLGIAIVGLSTRQRTL
jgi:hypothetical protein